MRSNIEACDKVCFEVDRPGEVFAYGQFECHSSLAYTSFIAFGRIAVVDDLDDKRRFCSSLMAKYGAGIEGREKDVFPRIGGITVYAISVERFTGKHISLPAAEAQWPAMDRTRTPGASTR